MTGNTEEADPAIPPLAKALVPQKLYHHAYYLKGDLNTTSDLIKSLAEFGYGNNGGTETNTERDLARQQARESMKNLARNYPEAGKIALHRICKDLDAKPKSAKDSPAPIDPGLSPSYSTYYSQGSSTPGYSYPDGSDDSNDYTPPPANENNPDPCAFTIDTGVGDLAKSIGQSHHIALEYIPLKPTELPKPPEPSTKNELARKNN